MNIDTMEKNSILHIDDSNFANQVENAQMPVVLDFWADWCGPCRMMGPVFEELSQDYGGKVKFAKVNTDENLKLASKFHITGIPSLVLMRDGKEIDRIVGYAPRDVLKSRIDSVFKLR